MTARPLLLVLSPLCFAGCASDQPDVGGPPPVLSAVSRDQVSVGQSLDFFGGRFLSGADGHTEIELAGSYLTDEGDEEEVSLRIRPHHASSTRLVWADFGPYDIPFSSTGRNLGVFDGTVTAVNVDWNTGEEARSEPLPIALRVEPSVIVRDLRPVESSCEEPVRRALGGIPYRVDVEAAGIDPVDFTVEIFDQAGAGRTLQVPADGGRGELGAGGELVLAPVPAGDMFYVARLIITARDAAGGKAVADYAIGVHRQLEYIDFSSPQIGQIHAAVAVTGCIAGGANGQTVSYAETEPDTRARHIAYHWDSDWAEGRDDEIDGLPEIARWGVTHSVGGEPIGPDAETWTVGTDYSAADTESWAHYDVGGIPDDGDDFWAVSSADSLSPTPRGDIIPGMFGVWWRQMTRVVHPGGVVEYNVCGEPRLVADAMFADYTWAASLAQADECPPLPRSSLPDELCNIAPCD